MATNHVDEPLGKQEQITVKTSTLAAICQAIDKMSIRTGKIASWLSLILIGIVCYEVAARYFFNSPTNWSMELGTFLFAGVWLFCGAWTYQAGSHVKMDVLYSRFSLRGRAIIDLCTSPFVILMMVAFVWYLFNFGIYSMNHREVSPSLWAPPIWIVKMALPFGTLLLALQAVAKIIRDIHIVVTGRALK